MEAADMSRADWRKSSFSGGNGNCVEVADWRTSSFSGGNGNCVETGSARRGVAVRDTKDRDGVTLVVPASAWREFIRGLKS